MLIFQDPRVGLDKEPDGITFASHLASDPEGLFGIVRLS